MNTVSQHTHRGTCQACGRHQAIDNGSRLVAKHGYTVDFGYFNGTCYGSGHMPAEFDITLTRKTIEECKAEAVRLDELAAGYAARTLRPALFERWDPNAEHVDRSGYKHKGKMIALPIERATPAELEKAQRDACQHATMQAKGLRSHADMLRTAVLPRKGCEPYPVTRETHPTFERGQRIEIKRKDGTSYGVTLTRPAYSSGFTQRCIGWYGRADGNPREGRFTTRELRQAVQS